VKVNCTAGKGRSQLRKGKNRSISPFLSLAFTIPIAYIHCSYRLHLPFLSLTKALPITYIYPSYHLQRPFLSRRGAIFMVREGEISHREGRTRGKNGPKSVTKGHSTVQTSLKQDRSKKIGQRNEAEGAKSACPDILPLSTPSFFSAVVRGISRGLWDCAPRFSKMERLPNPAPRLVWNGVQGLCTILRAPGNSSRHLCTIARPVGNSVRCLRQIVFFTFF